MTAFEKTRVYLVGAGPGDPSLLTLRAVECLALADLVIYDRLVPARMLEHAPPTAIRTCVTDLAGCHGAGTKDVCDHIIAAVQRGQRVVRLKGGDPFIFGRGGEEAEALQAAGIAFEVVPGVTAALGAAACAGIPLTHRAYASNVVFVTGHENPDKPETMLDWNSLARCSGTLVIYMGVAQLPRIVECLLQHGKPPSTPAALVQWATTAEQRTVTARLVDLPLVMQSAHLASPAIVIVGSVVDLRDRLGWFEQRPLFGKQVLITRPRHQAAEMRSRLELLGARVWLSSTIEIGPPKDWMAADAAIERLSEFQWLVFTSANGVHAFFGRLHAKGRDARSLGTIRIAVIGPATAEALRGYSLNADVTPSEYSSEGLVACLMPLVSGQRVLSARADRGRELLHEELSKIAFVDEISVYSQVDAIAKNSEVIDRLRRGQIDFVTLTSSNIARAFLNAMDEPCRTRIKRGEIRLVSISPITSETIRELGFPVAGEARAFTTEGVIESLIGLAKIPIGVPAQVEQDAAANEDDNVHRGANAAVRNADEHI